MRSGEATEERRWGWLLSHLDRELGGGPRRWSDLVFLRNVGPMRVARGLAGDRASNRGFNALLLDRGGQPSHYLKVRRRELPDFEREVRIHLALSSHPRTRGFVVPALALELEGASVLATEFVGGARLHGLLGRRKGDSRFWMETVSAFLDCVRPLWGALAEVAPSGESPRCPLDQAASDLESLRDQGVDAGTARELLSRLEGVTLPDAPQHGDLWPRNVFRVGDSVWRLLDFETSGAERTPLYDLFHFARGSVGAAGIGRGKGWIWQWVDAVRVDPRLRSLFSEHLGALDEREVEAALILYLLRFASALYQRWRSMTWATPVVRFLGRLPTILEQRPGAALLEAAGR